MPNHTNHMRLLTAPARNDPKRRPARAPCDVAPRSDPSCLGLTRISYLAPRSVCFTFAAITYRLAHCGTAAFGMRTYKKVGTDPTLLACYAAYQRFCSTLKLDWLFQLELLAFSLLGVHELTWQWWASIVAQLPLALLWLPIGLRAARQESVSLMLMLLLGAALQPFVYGAQLLSLPAPNATHVHPHRNATLALAGSEGWSGLGHGQGLDLDQMDGTGNIWGTSASRRGMTSYCTQRLRERTFPFASAPLNALYLLALGTRLALLAAAITVRGNFGKGLASRVHARGQRSQSGSSTDPFFQPTGSTSLAAAAADFLLPQPVADHHEVPPWGEATRGHVSTSGSDQQASRSTDGAIPVAARLTLGTSSSSAVPGSSLPASHPGSFHECCTPDPAHAQAQGTSSTCGASIR